MSGCRNIIHNIPKEKEPYNIKLKCIFLFRFKNIAYQRNIPLN